MDEDVSSVLFAVAQGVLAKPAFAGRTAKSLGQDAG